MTDPTLKPEDRALIERVTGRPPAPWMKDAPILGRLFDAARDEGRRASGEGGDHGDVNGRADW